jgi:uncharacterized protein YggT (Ycf19 family)
MMILLVIGSLVSLFTGSTDMAFVCKEWIDLLLGPLRRYRLQIGPLDLSPVVYIIALSFLRPWLSVLLHVSYFASP